jgi:DNA polymerase III epsilon subunit-like protein
LVLDTETTGLPDWQRPADAEGQPRLASWCMIFCTDDLDVEFTFSALVKPDGWEMPEQAQRINGLSTERLNAEGHSILWPLSLLALAVQQGRILAAHNIEFDAKIMRGELRRAIGAHVEDFGFWATARSVRGGICTMRSLVNECKLPHPSKPDRYKFPRLTEACQIILKEELADAHNCVTDAKACLKLLRAMRERDLLPRAA